MDRARGQPRGTIYGTIAAGLVIAARNPYTTTYPRVLSATAIAVASYWLAHGYPHWAGERLRRGADLREGWPVGRLGDALRDEWPIIEGGAALLIAWMVGAPLPTAVTADLWTAAAALAVFEIASGLRRHLRPSYLLANATVGLALGLALFGVKLLLH